MTDRSASGRARAWIGILLAAYLLFVVYGSLVPLRFTPRDLDDALAAFAHLRFIDKARTSRTDFATNVLLFVPLAFLAAQAAAPRGAAWPGLRPLLFAAAVALAVALEFTQLFFPPRTSSLGDVLAESIGAVIGLAIQRRRGARFDDWFADFWQLRQRTDRVQRLLATYVVLLFLFNLMPLDLTVSPVEIYHKWRQGGVVVVPFTGMRGDWFADAYEIATDALVWLPAGVLWALRPGATLRRILLKALLLSALLEVLQLFVMSRTSDPTDVIMAVAGAALGVRVARSRAVLARLDGGARARLLGTLWVVWLVVVLGIVWFPFDFDPARATWQSAWAAMTRTPFVTYFFRTEFGGLNELLRKVLAFLPGGLLLGLIVTARPRPLWPVALLAALAALVEAGQLMLPGKTSDITDLFFEWIGGVAGFVAGGWVGWSVLASAPSAPPGPVSPAPPARTPVAPARVRGNGPAAYAAAVGLTAAVLLAAAHAPGVPYNVGKLLPAGVDGVLSALGLAAAVWWIALGPFLLLAPRRRRLLLLFPLALLLHGAVTWALLRLTVPLPMIHKIIGDPVLGWAWQWEDIGRYLALHVALSTQLLGAMLAVRLVLDARTLADFVHWLLFSLLLSWPLYWLVVEAAATDNVVELMRWQASYGAASALAGAVFLLCLSACAVSAAIAGGRRRGTLLVLAALAAAGSTGLVWLGQEPMLVKYDKVFSALQFLLSASRDRYASGAALFARYALAFAGATLLLALLQARAWRREAGLHASAIGPAQPALK